MILIKYIVTGRDHYGKCEDGDAFSDEYTVTSEIEYHFKNLSYSEFEKTRFDSYGFVKNVAKYDYEESNCTRCDRGYLAVWARRISNEVLIEIEINSCIAIKRRVEHESVVDKYIFYKRQKDSQGYYRYCSSKLKQIMKKELAVIYKNNIFSDDDKHAFIEDTNILYAKIANNPDNYDSSDTESEDEDESDAESESEDRFSELESLDSLESFESL